MVPTQSTQRTTAKNGTRLLNPAISLRRPEKRTKVSTTKKLSAVLTLAKPIALPTRYR